MSSRPDSRKDQNWLTVNDTSAWANSRSRFRWFAIACSMAPAPLSQFLASNSASVGFFVVLALPLAGGERREALGDFRLLVAAPQHRHGDHQTR